MFFCVKHKLYRLKLEMSVLSNVFATVCFESFLGFTSDIFIMSCSVMFYMNRKKKPTYKKIKEDFGHLFDKHPGNWEILCEKGYQGAVEF